MLNILTTLPDVRNLVRWDHLTYYPRFSPTLYRKATAEWLKRACICDNHTIPHFVDEPYSDECLKCGQRGERVRNKFNKCTDLTSAQAPEVQ